MFQKASRAGFFQHPYHHGPFFRKLKKDYSQFLPTAVNLKKISNFSWNVSK